MITCKTLSAEKEIEQLAVSWRVLHQKHGQDPFTSYDFAIAWWRHIGKPTGTQLMIAAAFDGERLVGLVPFSIRRKFGVRILRLLGNEIYYYRRFLIEDENLIEPLFTHVLQSGLYDFANIKNIHDLTPAYDFFLTAMTPLRKSIVYHRACHDDKPKDVALSFSKSFRRRIRRISDKIEGKSGFTFHTQAHEPPPSRVTEFIINQKRQWAKDRGKKGIFQESTHAPFFQALFDQTTKEGTSHYCWLEKDGDVVAAIFSILHNKVLYGHTTAYNPAYAKLSPGIYLTLSLIHWANAHGYCEVNFMEGHDDYKKSLTTTGRYSNEFIHAPTWRGKFFATLYQALIRRRARQAASQPGAPFVHEIENDSQPDNP